MFNERFILTLKELVADKGFQATYRLDPRAFTRTRALPFDRVVVGLCQLTKLSLQTNLNRLFKALGESAHVASASAFCQARQKLHFGALRALNTAAIDRYYREGVAEGLVDTWKGHRLLGVDGVYMTLPDTDETRAHYSIQRNSSSYETIQALGSCFYDVLNAIPINFELTPIQAEKHAIFTGHAAYWRPNDLTIYDRAYADYCVIAYHTRSQQDFVVRCPTRSSFRAIKEFMKSDQMDTEVTLRVTDRAKEFVRTHRLPEAVRVRLVKILLPTGEIEVLLTSLLDAARYPREALGELYQLRWGVETYFDHLKNQLDVPRWNSTKLNGLLQELYASLLISTLGNILGRSLDQALQQGRSDPHKSRKYRYKLNRVVLSQSLTESLVDLFLRAESPIQQTLNDLYCFMKQTPVPIRPHRSFPRRRLKSSEKLRYWRYKKRIWA